MGSRDSVASGTSEPWSPNNKLSVPQPSPLGHFPEWRGHRAEVSDTVGREETSQETSPVPAHSKTEVLRESGSRVVQV